MHPANGIMLIECAYAYTHIRANTHICTHHKAYANPSTHTYLCTCTHTHPCEYTCKCTDTTTYLRNGEDFSFNL